MNRIAKIDTCGNNHARLFDADGAQIGGMDAWASCAAGPDDSGDTYLAEIARRWPGLPAPPSQAQPDVTEAMVEAMVEAENVLVSLSENVAKHGNYTPESTVLFVGQALSAVRAALSAREGGGK